VSPNTWEGAAKSYLGEQLASSVEEGVKVIEQATLLGFDGQTAAVTLSGIETRIEADLVVTATATDYLNRFCNISVEMTEVALKSMSKQARRRCRGYSPAVKRSERAL